MSSGCPSPSSPPSPSHSPSPSPSQSPSPSRKSTHAPRCWIHHLQWSLWLRVNCTISTKHTHCAVLMFSHTSRLVTTMPRRVKACVANNICKMIHKYWKNWECQHQLQNRIQFLRSRKWNNLNLNLNLNLRINQIVWGRK
jgi:hypothetical protein